MVICKPGVMLLAKKWEPWATWPSSFWGMCKASKYSPRFEMSLCTPFVFKRPYAQNFVPLSPLFQSQNPPKTAQHFISIPFGPPTHKNRPKITQTPPNSGLGANVPSCSDIQNPSKKSLCTEFCSCFSSFPVAKSSQNDSKFHFDTFRPPTHKNCPKITQAPQFRFSVWQF